MVRTQTARHNIRNLEEGGYVTENHGVGGSIPPLGTTELQQSVILTKTA